MKLLRKGYHSDHGWRTVFDSGEARISLGDRHVSISFGPVRSGDARHKFELQLSFGEAAAILECLSIAATKRAVEVEAELAGSHKALLRLLLLASGLLLPSEPTPLRPESQKTHQTGSPPEPLAPPVWGVATREPGQCPNWATAPTMRGSVCSNAGSATQRWTC